MNYSVSNKIYLPYGEDNESLQATITYSGRAFKETHEDPAEASIDEIICTYDEGPNEGQEFSVEDYNRFNDEISKTVFGA